MMKASSVFTLTPAKAKGTSVPDVFTNEMVRLAPGLESSAKEEAIKQALRNAFKIIFAEPPDEQYADIRNFLMAHGMDFEKTIPMPAPAEGAPEGKTGEAADGSLPKNIRAQAPGDTLVMLAVRTGLRDLVLGMMRARQAVLTMDRRNADGDSALTIAAAYPDEAKAIALVRVVLEAARHGRHSPDPTEALRALRYFTENKNLAGIDVLLTSVTWLGPRIITQAHLTPDFILEIARMPIDVVHLYEILVLYLKAFNHPVPGLRENLYLVRRALEQNDKVLLDAVFNTTPTDVVSDLM
jgi:hypothetical protein